jgi:4-amino-4-deoxy-L-arabinose transferase-like glycosyltransferase
MIISICLRLAASLYLGNDLNSEQQERVYDQNSYDSLARRVLEGYGFSMGQDWWPMTKANAPTAHWSFLYVLFLAGVYAIFGYYPLAGRIIQALLTGILMPLLTYLLAKQVFDRRVGLIAAAICAFYSYFIFYSASLMTETFYMTAILWCLYLAGKIQQSEKSRYLDWFLLGVAMAITVLLRQIFIPVILIIGIWLIFATRENREKVIKGLFVSLSIVVLAILPWTIRNYRAFHQLVLLNTNAGYAFFWANHPIHGKNFIVLLPPEISYQSLIPPELHNLNEAAMENALMKRAIQFVLDDPLRYIILSLSRFKDQFKFWPSSGSGLSGNLLRLISFGIFLPFMIYGIYKAIKIWRISGYESTDENPGSSPRCFKAWLKTPVALWLAFFVVYTAVHLASWASIRYRLPTDAVTIIFAGLGVADLLDKLFPSAHPEARFNHGAGYPGD